MNIYMLSSREAIKRRLEEHFQIYNSDDRIKNNIRFYFDILPSNKVELFHSENEQNVIKFVLSLKLQSKVPNLIKCIYLGSEDSIKKIKRYNIKGDYEEVNNALRKVVSKLNIMNKKYDRAKINPLMVKANNKLVDVLLKNENCIKNMGEENYIPFDYKVISN